MTKYQYTGTGNFFNFNHAHYCNGVSMSYLKHALIVNVGFEIKEVVVVVEVVTLTG